MTPPPVITELVEHFARNADVYRSSLNETEVRVQFVDPFFEALGWDIHNKKHYGETYKDVIHEYSLRTAAHTEAPDYCFQVGGTRKFYVEAKRPAVHVSADPAPAYQLRSYAWTSKLPLSLLTNFAEFAVYDCRILPRPNDKPSVARIDLITFDQYPAKWSDIASRFSREAVYQGSFDRYTESSKLKKGTAEVDEAFLAEIESWRKELASNFALRNPSLNQRQVNFAVQQTIDRIIFLRICEDRGIEKYGQLQELQQGEHIYRHLCTIFERADEKYNSGLFHFTDEKGRAEAPDKLTPSLKIDDIRLKPILKRLYYPESPYQFSHFPADILGQVYEQFLGQVIRLTPGHQAKVEPKPEVLKAHGVYYTPTYIVDYIVQNTVGELLKGKTPKLASKLRVLDPACGSGSFLLIAYQFLLNWHRDAYLQDGAEKHRKELYQTQGGDWRLTTAEKKRILLNSIYGVDIDTQAVEVTKLSLLLKVLEGENVETLGTNLRLFHERALPDLGNNIKCGNSLIGPDFYEGKQMSFLDEEERYRVNVFDWHGSDGFPEIMKSGFDAVIGNPPYGYMIPEPEQDYFSNHYVHQDYQKDLYLLFLERYNLLLTAAGLLGVIVSNTWLQSITLRKIRHYLVKDYEWMRVLHLPDKVFHAVVDTHVIILRKGQPAPNASFAVDVRREGQNLLSHSLQQSLIPSDGAPVNIVAPINVQILVQKIFSSSVKLATICDVYNGIKPFEVGKGTPPQTKAIAERQPFVREGKKPGKQWKPLLRGSLIRRYANLWNKNYWVLYGPWLAAPRDHRIFDAPLKIMVRQTGDSITATLIESDFIARNNMHILLPNAPDYDLKYVLGLMNSRLMDFVYTFMNPEKGEALAEVKKQHIEDLPIRSITAGAKPLRVLHNRVVEGVEEVITLHRRLAASTTEHEGTALQRQIDASSRQIDQLVYQLYGLTTQEITLIENSTQQSS
jgi:type I restriction-modification system DNA methylase subunit